jgi:DMSO reductase anchor subunit
MALAEILIMDLRFKKVRQNEVLTEWVFIVNEAVKRLALAAGVVLIPVIILNLYHLYLLRTGTALAQASYDLLIQLYMPLLIARYLMLLVGVGILVLPVAMMERSGRSAQGLFTPAYMACLLVIIGEALGRFLFYAAHIRTGL